MALAQQWCRERGAQLLGREAPREVGDWAQIDFGDALPSLLPELRTRFGVKATLHRRERGLFLLKYSQVHARFSSPMVRECRGLILDARRGFGIVSYPFNKFFNFGEKFADEIRLDDWSSPPSDETGTTGVMTAGKLDGTIVHSMHLIGGKWHDSATIGVRVYDKLDGSLCTLYFFGGEWHVSSSGVPDASAPLPCGKVFADLFWQVWERCGCKLPPTAPTGRRAADEDACSESDNVGGGGHADEIDWTQFCFMFEMLTDENIIVVRPDRERIVLTGVRHLPTLQEHPPERVAKALGWECARSFPLAKLDDVIMAAKRLNPVEAEGFVVCDENFLRVKVKAPQYVALSHLTLSSDPGNANNAKNLLNIARHHEGGEFLAYFPAYRAQFEDIMRRLQHFEQRLVTDLEAICGRKAESVVNGNRRDSSESSSSRSESDSSEDSADSGSDSDSDVADRSMDAWQPLDVDPMVLAQRKATDLLDQHKIRGTTREPLLRILARLIATAKSHGELLLDASEAGAIVSEELLVMAAGELHNYVRDERRYMPESSSSSDDVDGLAGGRRQATRRQKRERKKQQRVGSVTASTAALPENDADQFSEADLALLRAANQRERAGIRKKPTSKKGAQKKKAAPREEENLDDLLAEFAIADAAAPQPKRSAAPQPKRAASGGKKKRKPRQGRR